MKTIIDKFVLVAPDCPVTRAIVPAVKRATPTVPAIQYELLVARPYTLTLEDLIFETHVRRAGLSRADAQLRFAAVRADLLAKPQACMRASALPKRYGWGVHYDGRGRLALYAMESNEYRRFAVGEVVGIKVVPAMRNQRAG